MEQISTQNFDVESVSRCRQCGEYVSSRFAKVFGDNEDNVYRCIECSSFRELNGGGVRNR